MIYHCLFGYIRCLFVGFYLAHGKVGLQAYRLMVLDRSIASSYDHATGFRSGRSQMCTYVEA